VISVLHFADIINRGDFIHNVLAHCDDREFSMSAVTLEGRGTLNNDPGELPVVNLAASGRGEMLRAVTALRKLLLHQRIDILHVHHYVPSLIGLVATIKLPTALVIGRHYSDAIYTLSRGLRRRIYLRLESLCNDAAASIVAPSAAVEAVLLAQGVRGAKIARIPYGFAFERLSPRTPSADTIALWGPEPGLRLGTFARLHPEKGHRYLAEALRRLKEAGIRATWLLAGDGPARETLSGLVRELGIHDRVRMLGWRTDPLDLMAASDIVVQPTLHEAFSQVMVEAMALGRPLVICDVSGVREVVQDGATGLVVPPRHSDALAAAILRLADPQEAARLSRNAARVIRKTLDIRLIAPRFEVLYRSVVAGRTP
jgi:glycosyltransferase involved in cell wall biosynthesis